MAHYFWEREFPRCLESEHDVLSKCIWANVQCLSFMFNSWAICTFGEIVHFPFLTSVCDFYLVYWVGQKVHLGFSIRCYRKNQNELFGQPILCKETSFSFHLFYQPITNDQQHLDEWLALRWKILLQNYSRNSDLQIRISTVESLFFFFFLRYIWDSTFPGPLFQVVAWKVWVYKIYIFLEDMVIFSHGNYF